jgi:predicted metal-dependent enzyme (double-stranded beta helix superfamily)
MFDLEQFIADCRAALGAGDAHGAIRELVARAVSEPSTVLRVLGEPRRAELRRLYGSPDLTILNVVWAPGMTLLPHDHRMWAVIGIYTGREDNIFWRRVRGDPGGKVEAVSARSVGQKEAIPLGDQVIHSVTNPVPRLTGGIHVYGGDFFAIPRSEWDPETLLEQPSDGERTMRRFEEANALWSKR